MITSNNTPGQQQGPQHLAPWNRWDGRLTGNQQFCIAVLRAGFTVDDIEAYLCVGSEKVREILDDAADRLGVERGKYAELPGAVDCEWDNVEFFGKVFGECLDDFRKWNQRRSA